MQLRPAEQMRGTVRVPGDASIAHRALLLGSMAKGQHVVEGVPTAADVQSTVSCLRQLGTFIEEMPDGRVLVLAKDLADGQTLDVGGSLTTTSLLAGLLAGHPLRTTIDGDASVRNHSIDLIAEPLRRMGAKVTTSEGHLPMTIEGGPLRAIRYNPPIASARGKAAVLVAALLAEGDTIVEEAVRTRDHTERLLSAMSVPIDEDDNRISIRGGTAPKSIQVTVPGDITSAALFIVAALCLEGSEIYLPTVGVNPTRTGFLDLLAEMGADIEYVNRDSFLEEPIADIAVRSGKLNGKTIKSELTPSLVAELPILAVAATQAQGETIVHCADDLRREQSGRIASIIAGLKTLGADIKEHGNDLVVRGPTPLRGGELPPYNDQGVAMALSIAGLLADGETDIADSLFIDRSYPTFFNDILSVTRPST
jgi:3-phosphoshikimate 1-carboxyvinyltransferase